MPRPVRCGPRRRRAASLGVWLVGLALACAPRGSDSSENDSAARDTTPRTRRSGITPGDLRRPDTVGRVLLPGLLFDPPSIRPGDRIGDFTVIDADVSRTSFDSSYVGTVTFAGELTLRGRTIPHFDSDVKAVCFEADRSSAAHLPRWPGDERRPWFCFENIDLATRLLGRPGVERPATVVIDRFTAVRAFTDAVNSARLLATRD